MQVKTEHELTREIRDIIKLKVPNVMSRTRATQKFYQLNLEAKGLSQNSEISWILHAQIGTLEKMGVLFSELDQPSSLEILAAARNLFENLVWLKLFLKDHTWGHFFYGQLLSNQRQELTGLIAKFESEAALFESLDKRDSEILHQVFTDEALTDNLTKEKSDELNEEFNTRTAELDRQVRQTFALFAESAAINGYGFQSHLIRTKHIPEIQERLDLIENHIEEFRVEIGDHDRVGRFLGKWNWRGESDRVDMVEQYDFLYRLTSRLLHSTPMNIITEKNLLKNERLLLLNYVVIALEDALDCIENFDFPGKIRVFLLDTEQL